LSLVSGRPVSFIQDLYQPLYVPRPVVGPDLIASAEPQTHEGNLQDASRLRADAGVGGGAGGINGSAHVPIPRRMTSTQGQAGAQGPQGPEGPKGDSGVIQPNLAVPNFVVGSPSVTEMNADAIRQSVLAQASGQKAGELFQYNIATPVTLPRQQAALIPIVAEDIDADKLLLFNPDNGSRFPLNAVRIRNTTNLHLKGGPVTLFDAGVYAGDARMEDIPPGDNRLLSYAVDVSVEGARLGPTQQTMETTLILKHGVLTITRRQHQETTYTLKSKSDQPRTVLIEHPFQPEYKLVAPEKATEQTASLYRFAVTLAPEKSQTLKVVTELPVFVEVGILTSDLDELLTYARSTEVSAKLRSTLLEVVQRRKHIQELKASASARSAEVASISGDQERIRKNMGALDKASALYKRYVGELDAQETRIEALRQEAIRLSGQAEAADRDLRAFIDAPNGGNTASIAP
jgi:hypothetical protein